MRRLVFVFLPVILWAAADTATAQGSRVDPQHEAAHPPAAPPPLDDTPTDRTGNYPKGALAFDTLDHDHDGALSVDEIGGTPVKLSECDANGDGRISRDEYAACRKM